MVVPELLSLSSQVVVGQTYHEALDVRPVCLRNSKVGELRTSQAISICDTDLFRHILICLGWVRILHHPGNLIANW